jgi:hypothetical protein
MGMLAAVSKSSPVLSRPGAAVLIAAAIVLFILPTFRPAPVAANEEKAPKSTSQHQKTEARGTSSAPVPSSNAQGDAAAAKPTAAAGHTAANLPPSFANFLLLPGDVSLQTLDFRKEIGISDEQEKKLRAISAATVSSRPSIDEKKLNSLPQKEQEAKVEEWKANMAKWVQASRRQVAEVLTADQRATYQHHIRGKQAYNLLQHRQETPGEWGITLSQRQLEQLERIQREYFQKDDERMQQGVDRMFGVLTAAQRKRLTDFADANVAGLAFDVPSPTGLQVFANTTHEETPFEFYFLSPGGASVLVYVELRDPDLRKKLGLTAEQQAKLQKVQADSRAAAEAIFALYEPKMPPNLSPEELPAKLAEIRGKLAKSGKQVEYQKKLEELGKNMIRKIDAVLTPQQLDLLKKTLRRNREMGAMRGLNPQALGYVRATPEEVVKLRQLREDLNASLVRLGPEFGEKAWNVLTLEQQKTADKYLSQFAW